MIQPSWKVTSLVAARAGLVTDTTPPPAAMPASSAAEPPSMWRRVRSWLVGVRLICPPRGFSLRNLSRFPRRIQAHEVLFDLCPAVTYAATMDPSVEYAGPRAVFATLGGSPTW